MGFGKNIYSNLGQDVIRCYGIFVYAVIMMPYIWWWLFIIIEENREQDWMLCCDSIRVTVIDWHHTFIIFIPL